MTKPPFFIMGARKNKVDVYITTSDKRYADMICNIIDYNIKCGEGLIN